MKKLPAFALLSIFAVLFIAGFLPAFKFSGLYIQRMNEKSVENEQQIEVTALAFSGDIVKTFKSGSIDDFKRKNPQYSFLVPKGEENYFAEQLEGREKGVVFKIEVEKINTAKQRIRFSEDHWNWTSVDTYEATDTEVFPVSTTFVSLRYTPIKLFTGSIGGSLLCLIFFAVYRKFLV